MKCKEIFIIDVQELCETCFIHEKIRSVRKNMIRKFELISDNNSNEFTVNYLKNKIETANEKIENVLNTESNSNGNYRENRVALFLSWKDCLNYFNSKLYEIENQKYKTFDELFDNAFQNKKINFDNINEIPYIKALINGYLNEWLIKTKGLDYNNERDYNKILSIYFDEFVEHYNKTEISNFINSSLENMMNKAVAESDYNELNRKLEIAIAITGFGKHNLNNTQQPVFHYIKAVLIQFSLDNLEAKDIVFEMQGAFSPNFNKNVTDKIINYLKGIEYFQGKNEKVILNRRNDSHKNNNWFKVGLLFASGEIYKHYDENNKSATATARALGNNSYRVYITQTFGHNEKLYGKKDDKNIFLNLNKMTQIINHCEENGITIDETFVANYNTLKSKS
jgi:hypothetical protein